MSGRVVAMTKLKLTAFCATALVLAAPVRLAADEVSIFLCGGTDYPSCSNPGSILGEVRLQTVSDSSGQVGMQLNFSGNGGNYADIYFNSRDSAGVINLLVFADPQRFPLCSDGGQSCLVSSPPLVNGFGDFNYLVLTGQGEYLTFTLFAANPTLNLSLSDFLVPSTGVRLSGGNPFVAAVRVSPFEYIGGRLPTPEPGSASLLGVGLAAVLGLVGKVRIQQATSGPQ